MTLISLSQPPLTCDSAFGLLALSSFIFLYFYYLIFNRIYQFAKLNYTKEATSNKPKAPAVYDLEGGSSNTLLNLDPEDAVFYVGGYPPDFEVSIDVVSLSRML